MFYFDFFIFQKSPKCLWETTKRWVCGTLSCCPKSTWTISTPTWRSDSKMTTFTPTLAKSAWVSTPIRKWTCTTKTLSICTKEEKFMKDHLTSLPSLKRPTKQWKDREETRALSYPVNLDPEKLRPQKSSWGEILPPLFVFFKRNLLKQGNRNWCENGEFDVKKSNSFQFYFPMKYF